MVLESLINCYKKLAAISQTNVRKMQRRGIPIGLGLQVVFLELFPIFAPLTFTSP